MAMGEIIWLADRHSLRSLLFRTEHHSSCYRAVARVLAREGPLSLEPPQ